MTKITVSVLNQLMLRCVYNLIALLACTLGLHAQSRSSAQVVTESIGNRGRVAFKETPGINPLTLFSFHGKEFGLSGQDEMRFVSVVKDNDGWFHYKH